MATNITYNGRGTSLPHDDIIVEGLTPWPAGETRLFDDAYASAHGWRSGDDFAEYVAGVYNRNRAEPWFTLEAASDTPTAASESPAESPAEPEPDPPIETAPTTSTEEATLAPPPTWPEFGTANRTEGA